MTHQMVMLPVESPSEMAGVYFVTHRAFGGAAALFALAYLGRPRRT